MGGELPSLKNNMINRKIRENPRLQSPPRCKQGSWFTHFILRRGKKEALIFTNDIFSLQLRNVGRAVAPYSPAVRGLWQWHCAPALVPAASAKEIHPPHTHPSRRAAARTDSHAGTRVCACTHAPSRLALCALHKHLELLP